MQALRLGAEIERIKPGHPRENGPLDNPFGPRLSPMS
jgi:hypothetical protein